MKIEIDVPDYSTEQGLQMVWEPGFEILAEIQDKTTVVAANRAGLLSLVRLLLTLANPNVPAGDHWHLDEPNSLQPGSSELIFVKI